MAFLGAFQSKSHASLSISTAPTLPAVREPAVKTTRAKSQPLKKFAVKTLSNLLSPKKSKVEVVEVEKVVEKPVYVDRVVEVEKIVEVEKPSKADTDDSVFFPSTVPDEWTAEVHSADKSNAHSNA